MKILKSLLDLLYDDEHICYGCGGSCQDFTHICPSCRSGIVYEKVVSNKSLDYVDEVYSVIEYEGLARELMHRYKYSQATYLSLFFGNLLTEFILESGLKSRVDEIYYVPAHPSRESARGYNQCQLLAEYIGESLELPVSKEVLVKTFKSADQIGLSGVKRRENLQNVFQVVDRSFVEGKRILLVDDIITTGTTVDRCGEVLKKNGCAELIALSVTATD